ncbi:glycoside hydrolase family 25 protein, partial [Nocardioides pelophilus]|uniref:glycoside hydrolase family 25 protein n=1 Tax=Nocardioides pelophilus TaxID=2172019 RepID=UPI0028AB8C48
MHRSPGLVTAGLVTAGVVLLAAVGCGSADKAEPAPSTTRSATSASDPATSRSAPAPSPTTSATTSTTSPAAPEPSRVRVRGIDASHHQGAIDWAAVAGDGIAFAYLKASEGTTYVDPTFADHRAAALARGVAVGGYHYFQLCSSGVEQATHFASVLGNLRPDGHLPPAVDLGLA